MDLEDIIINAHVIDMLDRVENFDIPPRRPRFHVRDDPFELEDEDFIRVFRLNKAAARNLIEIVEPHLIRPTRISAIDSVTKVIIL